MRTSQGAFFQEQACRLQGRKETAKETKVRPASARDPSSKLPKPSHGPSSGSEPSNRIPATSRDGLDSGGTENRATVVPEGPLGVLLERKEENLLKGVVVCLDKMSPHEVLQPSLALKRKSAKKVKMKMTKRLIVASGANNAQASADAALASAADGKGVEVAEKASDEGRRAAKKRRVTIAPVKCRGAEKQIKEQSVLPQL